MRLAAILFIAACIGPPASAQLADSLSRRLEPNALDRAVPPPPSSSATRDSLAQAERQRAERQARTLAPLPPSSALNDGPSGVQRIGSGSVPPEPPAAPPPPPR
jgi:hypothetical protein